MKPVSIIQYIWCADQDGDGWIKVTDPWIVQEEIPRGGFPHKSDRAILSITITCWGYYQGSEEGLSGIWRRVLVVIWSKLVHLNESGMMQWNLRLMWGPIHPWVFICFWKNPLRQWCRVGLLISTNSVNIGSMIGLCLLTIRFNTLKNPVVGRYLVPVIDVFPSITDKIVKANI